MIYWASLLAQMVKNPPAMQETQVRSLGQEDPLKEGNGNLLQDSCLENSMDRRAWQATVHRVPKNQTWLSDYYLHICLSLKCGNCQISFSWAPKSMQVVTTAMKLKDTCSLKGKLWQTWQHIKKQRHHFANKDPYSQSYGFSSGHAQMWELDHKEGWVPKNWCCQTVML